MPTGTGKQWHRTEYGGLYVVAHATNAATRAPESAQACAGKLRLWKAGRQDHDWPHIYALLCTFIR